MMQQFKLINNSTEEQKYQHIKTISVDDESVELLKIYNGNEYLLIYKLIETKNDEIENQIEIPLSALSWLCDTIENGFWRKPSDGGLAKNQHAVKDHFDNEEILISRSSNAGTYGKSGFNIRNKSRQCYIASWDHQTIQVTDELLQNELLAIFKRLIP